MSYSEENGQVVLTMSREDYDKLLMCLGAATERYRSAHMFGGFDGMLAFLDRLNSGNPHYTPYQALKNELPEKIVGAQREWFSSGEVSAPAPTPTNRVEYLLREAMASAVRLAIARHNLELDPDAATEEEIAYDAAGACFGEECCDDKPIPEVAELLARVVASEVQPTGITKSNLERSHPPAVDRSAEPGRGNSPPIAQKSEVQPTDERAE